MTGDIRTIYEITKHLLYSVIDNNEDYCTRAMQSMLGGSQWQSKHVIVHQRWYAGALCQPVQARNNWLKCAMQMYSGTSEQGTLWGATNLSLVERLSLSQRVLYQRFHCILFTPNSAGMQYSVADR